MSRNRNRRGRRIRTVLMVTAILAVCTVSGMMYLRKRVSSTYAEDNADTVESEAVTTGSLSTTVPGTGTLEAVGAVEVTIPSGVDVSRIFYEEGTSVSEGSLLFSVDSSSVLSAMKQVQSQIDTLDAELEEAGSDEVSETLTSGVSGRIKKIYAAEGDDVSSVMYADGALAVLSLDGYMAAEIETGLLAENDTVTVVTSDGIEYTGTVESTDDGKATVLITDDGPRAGDTVTVLMTQEDEESTEQTEAETEVGSGILFVHSPLNITGYAGTVSEVNVEENESIDADTTILTLSDTSYSANYNSILSQRAELEETLQDLITLYREGGVYASSDGVINSVTDEYETYIDTDTTSDSSGSAEEDIIQVQESDKTASADTSAAGAQEDGQGESGSDVTILTIDPGRQMTVSVDVDETDILSMELGQTAAVTIDSIGDEEYQGIVTSIDTAASSESGVSTYTVEVTIDRTEKMLAGMSASVSITIDGTENALLVPAEAVHQSSTSSYVYTICDESGELGGMVEVTTGITDGSQTEIISGLKEGDIVYYEETQSGQQSGFGQMGQGQMGGFGGMNGAGMPGEGTRPSGSSSGNASDSGRSQRSGSGSSSAGPGGNSGGAPG